MPMTRPPVLLVVRTHAISVNVFRFGRAVGQTAKLPLPSAPGVDGDVIPSVVSHQIRPLPAAPNVTGPATPPTGELCRTTASLPFPDESLTVVAPAASPNR